MGLTSIPATNYAANPLAHPARAAALIYALCAEVGLHSGATVGSLVARVAALEAEGITGPSSATPQAVGTAAAGVSAAVSRDDHVHAATTTGVTAGALLTSGDWATSPPATVTDALNRMSALLKTLNTSTAIP